MMDERGLEFTICDCSLKWRKLYNQMTMPLNLQGLERRIILTVHNQPNITQVTLADCLEQEPQSLTRILDRMEAKSWIAKIVSPTDRRAKCLSLTDDGRLLHEKIMQLASELRPQILEGVSDEEVRKVSEILCKIKTNIERMI